MQDSRIVVKTQFNYKQYYCVLDTINRSCKHTRAIYSMGISYIIIEYH